MDSARLFKPNQLHSRSRPKIPVRAARSSYIPLIMTSVAFVGACLISCFVSIANPWFYTTTCGRDGCPACRKVANRGRQGVSRSAVELSTRAEELRNRGQTDAEQAARRKKRWFQGCGWESEEHVAEDRVANAQESQDMQENPGGRETSSSFLGTPGVASQSEPYRGTRPMRIDVSDPYATSVPGNSSNGVPGGSGTSNRGADEAGISLGVDVSHMAPAPRPVDPAVIDRAIANKTDDFGGSTGNDKDKHVPSPGTDPEKPANEGSRSPQSGSKELARARTVASEDRTSGGHGVPSVTYPSRPLLDEAISWDRLAGVGKENKKRRWWHMP